MPSHVNGVKLLHVPAKEDYWSRRLLGGTRKTFNFSVTFGSLVPGPSNIFNATARKNREGLAKIHVHSVLYYIAGYTQDN